MTHGRFEVSGALLCATVFSLGLALAWLLSDHIPPWTAFHSDTLVAVALCATALCAARCAGSMQVVPRSALVVAALAAVPLIQYQAGLVYFLGDAVMASLYLAGFAFAIQVGAALRRADARSMYPLAWGLVFASIVSAALALAQWLRLDVTAIPAMTLAPNGRPFANFGQPNQLATALMLGVAATALLVEWRHIGAVTFTCISSFLALGVALTQSRAGALQAGGLVIWLLLIAPRSKLVLPRSLVALFAITFVATVVVLPSIAVELQLASAESLRVSTGTRPIHWATVTDAIFRAPWAGYGWNQTSVAVAAVAIDHPPSGEMIEHSHNLVLDLLAWNGLPLGLLIMGAASWWLYARIDECRNGEAALLIGMLGLLALHSLVEFPLEYAYFLLPAGFIVGQLSQHHASAAVQIMTPRVAVAATACLLAALTLKVCAEYMVIEENHRQLRFESAGIGADRIAPAVPDIAILTQLREFLLFARTPARRSMSSDELHAMSRVAQRYGYPSVLFRYAYALGLNGKHQEAALVLARLCKLSPESLCTEAASNWRLLTNGTAPELAAVSFPPSPWRVEAAP